MRLLLATCQVDYAGRLSAHLPRAKRLIIVKADGSVLIHSDGGSYKPLNWMSPPCRLRIRPGAAEPALEKAAAEPDGPETDGAEGAGPETDGAKPGGPLESEKLDIPVPRQVWEVTQEKTGDTLQIQIFEVFQDFTEDLGVDPGLKKDGVEAHLQQLLAEAPHTFGQGFTLVRREYPTAIGPVDLLLRDAQGRPVAVEVKRRGEIDGVEQLTRYLELLRRHVEFADIRGIFAAQEIKKQARTLAEDRGIECVVVDYDALRGLDDSAGRLF